MAFGTTNYPVFVEFELLKGERISIALGQITSVKSDSDYLGRTVIVVGEDYPVTVAGTYSETMAKINGKIPKPAKWPPAIESKKDDSLPPQNTYPRSGDSHRLF